MEKNIGQTDRIIRVIVGVLVAAAGYYYSQWWLYLIAAGILVSAVFAYCPPYKWFKINTT